jgi:hypothetical protein
MCSRSHSGEPARRKTTVHLARRAATRRDAKALMLLVTPQPDDDWKDVPETNEKHEGHAGNRRADLRRGGDLGQNDITDRAASVAPLHALSSAQ